MKWIAEVESRQRQAGRGSESAAAKLRRSGMPEAIPTPATACRMNRRRVSVWLKLSLLDLRRCSLLIMTAVIASAVRSATSSLRPIAVLPGGRRWSTVKAVRPGAMKTSILIVEDEGAIRELVKLALGSDKYELCEAGDLAGLRQLLAGPAPGAVILDLNLSDGNSLALLPELKRKWPASKVIILTGHGSVEVAEEAFKVDPQLFLQSKPFDPETLGALVELALAGNPVPQRQ